MLTSLNRSHIFEAFPQAIRAAATQASRLVHADLASRQWTEIWEFTVGQERIRMPARLCFSPGSVVPQAKDDVSLMACAMHSRSGDGYQRQRAARELLPRLNAWTAPFILCLIGEWIAEILEDIDQNLSEDGLHLLAQCARENPAFWQTTKRRVESYWNVYYKASYRRAHYPGFKVMIRVESILQPSRAHL